MARESALAKQTAAADAATKKAENAIRGLQRAHDRISSNSNSNKGQEEDAWESNQKRKKPWAPPQGDGNKKWNKHKGGGGGKGGW